MNLKPQKIFRSNRKTVAFIFNEYGELIVKAPKRMAKATIGKLIERYEVLLIAEQKKILSERQKIKKYQFQEGEEFLFLGCKLKLKFVSDEDLFVSRRFISTSEKHLFLPLRFKTDAKKEIEKFYRKEAMKIFTSRVQFYIQKYFEIFGERLAYTNLKITSGQKTVGSCSAKNSLNFSWKLIQAPIQVVDYVVAHEIVHIKEKHHQKSFWEKLKKLIPDYRKNIEWLKENWFYLKEFLLYD